MSVHCSNSAGSWNSNVCRLGSVPSPSPLLSFSLFDSLGSFLGRSVLISMVTWKKDVNTKIHEGGRRQERQRIYRRILTAVVNTHRPIILELNVHHGLEYTILDSV